MTGSNAYIYIIYLLFLTTFRCVYGIIEEEYEVVINKTFVDSNGTSIAITSTSNTECACKCLLYQSYNGHCCDAEFEESTMSCFVNIDTGCRTVMENISGRNILLRKRKYVELGVDNGEVHGDLSTVEYCPRGQFGIGYKMRIESGCSDCVAVDAIEIICALSNAVRSGVTALFPGFWGDWTEEILCQPGTFLTSFSLKVDPYKDNTVPYDDTAVNNVKFKCRKLTEQGTSDISLSWSNEAGSYGAWSNSCSLGNAICGFKLSFQSYQGHGLDDTGLNDIKFICCD